MNEPLVSRALPARALLALVVGALSVGRAAAAPTVQDDWARINGGSPEYVVVDSSGNAYAKVSGGTYRYDAAGNAAFVAGAPAILGANLVARTSAAADGSLVVAVADDAGTALWQAQLPRVNATVARANIAADAAGDVYLAASGADPATGVVAPFLAKVGPGGVAWVVDAIAASGLAVDAATGAAYLTGAAGTAAYGAAGQALWTSATPGTDVKLLASGAVCVVNRLANAFALEVSLFDAAGNLTSSASGAFPLANGRVSRAAAIDDAGNTYLAAGGVFTTGLLVKFDARGAVIWSHELAQYRGTIWYAVALDAKQDVYVAGQTYDYTSRWIGTTAKYDRNLGAAGPTWVEVNAAGGGAVSVAVDGARNVYTLGTANGAWAQLVKSSQHVTITATAGAGGSVSPAGAVDVLLGGSRTFTVAPATGYHVADVLLDGVSLGPVTSATVANVEGDRTLAASFAIDTYAITASAGANGGISPAGTTTVTSGGTLAYAIAPAAGYAVADVLVDGTSVGAVTSYTFTNVTAPHTIAATFRQLVTVTAPNGREAWKRGSTQTIRWTFAAGAGAAVKIELLSGTAVSRVIAASAPIGAAGAGSFTWKIPSNQATGTAYKVRVTSTTVPAATDSSDATFSITK